MKAFDLKHNMPEDKNKFDRPENYPVTVLLKKEKAEYSVFNQCKSLNEILLNWKETIMKNSFVKKYVHLLHQDNSSKQ